MSNFEVRVFRIDDVREHPNADRLTINRIKGYEAISNKLEDGSWRYQPDDLVLYIPEGAVVPEAILKTLNMWDAENGKGMLAGSKGDRVKAIKLRKVLSQGLIMPVDVDASLEQPTYYLSLESEEGVSERVILARTEMELLADNHADKLHIHKYEPPIPASMSGMVVGLGPDYTLNYDIENYQRWPDVLEPGEEVVATEKLHGTFTALCYWPGLNRGDMWNREFFAYSKGMGAKGLVMMDCPENNERNVYHRRLPEVFNPVKIAQIIGLARSGEIFGWDELRPVTILGETFGRGIQDLAYNQMDHAFRVFDVYVGTRSAGRYLDQNELSSFCQWVGLEQVPVIYQGPFDLDKIMELRGGKTSFDNVHVREGLVVRPARERAHEELGRVILKFINPDYLTRKGGTELQ